MHIQPYLFFEGRAEEAAEFYAKALGARVTMMLRFKDAPPAAGDSDNENCAPPPGSENKIMHMSLEIGGAVVMGSDGMCKGPAEFKGVSLALSVADDADAERKFAALGDGGTVIAPMTPTFFSSRFGMVTDRFGVTWMVQVAP
ncbi:VOC family protein [Pigmentiphaga kullae]|uniref:PhnB protein n=1 Tax=Pigmentiphaga kullae TaxID=151784 RepID=A0A4Q7NJW5_9BURK|nr:VOC family protein [Pigmentiphaga kullae]RZS85364.1 PhnB protein [Pigmentiphaga kullae]